MNVLSLFDGLSGGQIALDRLGLKVDNYFASEVDEYAIKITQKNYPNTIQIGDVTKVNGFDLPKIDLLIGGSPCQGFSIAGKQLNFDDPRSRLFFEFVRLKNELNPRYFLLENVSMKQEYVDVITRFMGVKPVVINSSLVSAQNRKRLYWTNIPIGAIVDRGLVLRDILEENPDPKFFLSKKAIEYMSRLRNGKPRWEYHKNPIDGKAATIVAVQYKGVPYGVLNDCRFRKHNPENELHHVADATDFKGNEAIKRVYAETGKAPTLTTMMGGHRHPKVLIDGEDCKYRRLTPLECERLQTLSDNYTEGVSNTQRYKMIGNGWTVEIIKEIFRGLARK